MEKIGLVIILLLGIFGVSLLMSLPAMLLWNGCLVPAVSWINEVSWLQTWGLIILFRLLFTTSSFSES